MYTTGREGPVFFKRPSSLKVKNKFKICQSRSEKFKGIITSVLELFRGEGMGVGKRTKHRSGRVPPFVAQRMTAVITMSTVRNFRDISNRRYPVELELFH